MGERVKNEAGDELELVGGRWVPVPKAGKAAGKPMELLAGSAFDKFGEAMAVSAGDQFNTLGMNARDLWASLKGDEQTQRKIEAERQEAGDIRARLHGESPVASMIGAALPTLPLMMLGAPAGGALRAGVSGAAQNAALGAAFSESGDYLQDAGMGAAMSAGTSGAQQIVSRVQAGRAAIREARQAGNVGSGIAGGMESRITDAEREIVDGAKRAGLTVLPGQETGNLTARKIEAGMAANPFLSGEFDKIAQGNQGQLNRLAARAMGVEADNVGMAVRAEAEHQIGEQFQDVGKKLGWVDVDPLIREVETMAADETTKLMPRTQIKGILADLKSGQKARLEGAAEGAGMVQGTDLMGQRSVIAGRMRGAYAAGNHELGQLYGEVLDKFDESIGKAALRMADGDPNGALAVVNQYSQARERWSVLRAMDRGGGTVDGNVLPGQAARIMKASDKTRYWGRVDPDTGQSMAQRGTGVIGENMLGDFYDALRFQSSQIGRPAVPNTGGTVGSLNSWLNSGGTVQSMTKGVVAKLGAAPLMRAYAAQSPLASQVMLFTQQALKGQPVGPVGATAGQGAARAASILGQ